MVQSVVWLYNCTAIKWWPQDLNTGCLVPEFASLSTMLCCLYVGSFYYGCYCPYLYRFNREETEKDWGSWFCMRSFSLLSFTTDLHPTFTFPVQKINSQPLCSALPLMPSSHLLLTSLGTSCVTPCLWFSGRLWQGINWPVSWLWLLRARLQEASKLPLTVPSETTLVWQRPFKTFLPALDSTWLTRADFDETSYFLRP